MATNVVGHPLGASYWDKRLQLAQYCAKCDHPFQRIEDQLCRQCGAVRTMVAIDQ